MADEQGLGVINTQWSCAHFHNSVGYWLTEQKPQPLGRAGERARHQNRVPLQSNQVRPRLNTLTPSLVREGEVVLKFRLSLCPSICHFV